MYLDQDSIDNRFGATLRAALCPAAADVTATIAQAEAEVESALRQGGYGAAVPSSTYSAIGNVPKQILEAAAGVWWRVAHGRQGISLPVPTPEPAASLIGLVDRIRTGELAVEGVAVDTARAVGGVLFTDSTSTASTARPQIFTREAWEGW